MATKSCWVLLVGADGKALAAGAKRIKKELEIVDDLRDAVREAYAPSVLAKFSAGDLVVYAPKEDGKDLLPLDPGADIPHSESGKPIIVQAPSGTQRVGLLCLCSLSFSFSFMCNADVH
jgi:hypothetical protein